MKRYFTIGFVTLLVGLGFAAWGGPRSLAAGSGTLPNLQLVIQGPWALCEIPGGGLQIILPNLKDNHYPPAFTADNAQYPLNADYPYDFGWKYAEYNLILNRGDGVMQLVNDGDGNPGDSTGGDPATLYREKGTCKTPAASDVSMVIYAPRPDEIWSLSQGAILTTSWDGRPGSNPPPSRQGPCQSGDCKHANVVVFRYLNVDLTKVKVTCDKKLWDCSERPNNDTPWPPPGALVPIPAGGDARLMLDLEPVVITDIGTGGWKPPSTIPDDCKNIGTAPSTTEEAMEEEDGEAFCTATRMVKAPRYLLSTAIPAAPKAKKPIHGPAKSKLIIVATQHRNCHAAPTLICQENFCP
ncbi:MAG: hypothetical protein ABSD39_14320 [Terriglobales bacterium]|jgi:hypothetical protein